MPSREILAISSNLLEAMRFFGRAHGQGEVLDCPGVSVICCGLNYAAFNAAVLSAPVLPISGELPRRLQLPAAHFERRNLRWTCWLCDDFLEPAAQRELTGDFRRIGLAPLTDPPGLYADSLLPPKRALPALQIRSVEDEPTRLAFAHITSAAFEIPQGVCRQIYANQRAWAGSFEGYVGYLAGQPVATAATVITGGVAGLYSVGTLPAHRRKGFAEAMMREALARVKERTGIQATVLQSSASGLSLYQRMGYRKLTRFSVFIS